VTAALFLDRDGVLNVLPPNGGYVLGPDELQVLPGVGTALAQIRRAVPDVRLIVVTNQRAVALGKLDKQTLDRIHARLTDAMAADGATIDAIEVCPHDIGVCDCRKPGVGLLQRAVAAFPEVDPARSALVGDSASDIVAGSRFGVRTWLVGDDEHRSEERALAREQGVTPDAEALSVATLAGDPGFLNWLSGGTEAAGTTDAPAAVATASTRG
jgi:histidinol-phosphate phosphatase family protein